jgi:CRP/FNR family cyclic AMP-dependent transcriptional regulator
MDQVDIKDRGDDLSRADLAHILLFENLPDAAVRDFEQAATWRHYGEGDLVFDQASDTLEVYFVVEGAVRILGTIADGIDVVLAEVPAGNFFGELSAIDGKGRSARVVAARPSRLASVDGKSFIDLMQRHPIVALRVMERMARIIRSLDTKVVNLSSLSEGQRVMIELIRLAEPDLKLPGFWSIACLPPHAELAEWAGTTREAVAQTIGELARDGIVKRRGLGLEIGQWERLQQLAKPSRPRGG